MLRVERFPSTKNIAHFYIVTDNVTHDSVHIICRKSDIPDVDRQSLMSVDTYITAYCDNRPSLVVLRNVLAKAIEVYDQIVNGETPKCGNFDVESNAS